MSKLAQFAADGFHLADSLPVRRFSNLAVLSLEAALRAYFSTYRTMRYFLHVVMDPGQDQRTVESHHTHDYAHAYAASILHFQHFAELVCKDLLSAQVASGTAAGVKKGGVYRLGFAAVLDELVKGQGPGATIASAHKSMLQKMAGLRNHLIHEGTFILHYPALDRLVGGEVLPFVSAILALPEYTGLEGFWRYSECRSGVDPLREIETHMNGGAYDLAKVAYLKEMGRAAYESPIRSGYMSKFFNEHFTRRYESMAREIARHEHNIWEVWKCPVCGVEALLIFDERDWEEDEEQGTTYGWWYTWDAECLCCSFHVGEKLGNASEHGLPIGDYWQRGNL